jgi:uncharacterized protein (TIGR02271 family)
VKINSSADLPSQGLPSAGGIWAAATNCRSAHDILAHPFVHLTMPRIARASSRFWAPGLEEKRENLMIDASTMNNLIGASVIGSDDRKIGTVGQVYVDPSTNQPNWISIRTGLFGTSESFAPVSEAEWHGDDVRIAYDKEFVKDAPRIDEDGSLSADDENALYSYYGNGGTHVSTGAGTGGVYDDADVDGATRGTGRRQEGYDTSGPTTDDAMTRSEERLHVGTEKVETGRARLVKHVVTEQQTVNVPVTHEEVRLEREPITEANRADATSGPDISEEEHEVVLTEERVVVSKETVPVERVRMGTETVTEQQNVTENVRKENIELVNGNTTGSSDEFRTDDGTVAGR